MGVVPVDHRTVDGIESVEQRSITTNRRVREIAFQRIAELTKGRIILGAGTAYSSLGKLESDGLIENIREEERRRIYIITPLGTQILHEEAARIAELYNNVKELL